MEKIIQFRSGIKLPAAIRHTTSPASSAQKGISDIEDTKDDQETLSPIYKKQNNVDNHKENNIKDLKILQVNGNKKYETDESDPPSPEINHKEINRVKSKLASYNPNANTSEQDESDIKELSLFKPPKNVQNNPEERKKALTVVTPCNKRDLNMKPIVSHQSNNIEDAISDTEKNSNVVYKEKEKTINNHPFRHLIFSPNITESTFKRFLILTHRGLVYAKKCLKQPSDKFIKSKQIMLKEQKNAKKKTLFLDLDETLIHTCQLKQNPEHVVLLPIENGNKISVGINVRPYCLEFLEKMSLFYEIYIFTASSYDYANEIINFIDSERKYISGLLVRENCMETKIGFFIKDLRIVKNRALKDMIIVDNLAHSFGFQVENGIPILEFHDDKYDEELKYLCDYLIEATQNDDLREFNKQKLRLSQIAAMKIEEIEI